MVKKAESETGARTRRVLMLCYYFPPLSSAGTQRSVGFARWLHDSGWTPVVLTVQRSRTRWEHGGEKIPQGISIIRTIELNLQGLLSLLTGAFNRLCDALGVRRRPSPFFTWCLPDPQIAWLSTWRGVRIARDVDCVYATCSPFSSALSATLIKLLSGKPLVLDFRDPWALNPHANYGRLQRRVLGVFERLCLRCCDALILNTPGAERLYRERYPQHAEKMSCIPNGFDALNDAPAPEGCEHLRIMHLGDFYRSRTPERLLEALARIGRDDIEFVQVGPSCEALGRFADRVRITHMSRVTHAEALVLMRTASVLYLTQGWEQGVDRYVSVASKTYEYLATGAPILAEVPAGDNADVIRRFAHRSWIVTDPDVDNLVAAVSEAYEARHELERRVTEDFQQTFNRRGQAASLAALLERTVVGAEPGTTSTTPVDAIAMRRDADV
jgi:hypothetical protein